MDGGAWWAAVHGVAQSQTWLSDFAFTFHFHAMEKEMATHSSVLAWRIPGTGEPGGLPSLGSHRVGHNWNDLAELISNFQLFWKGIYKLCNQDSTIWSAPGSFGKNEIYNKMRGQCQIFCGLNILSFEFLFDFFPLFFCYCDLPGFYFLYLNLLTFLLLEA